MLVAHWLYDLGSGVDVRDSVGGHDGVFDRSQFSDKCLGCR